jgi:hypothetical protein
MKEVVKVYKCTQQEMTMGMCPLRKYMSKSEFNDLLISLTITQINIIVIKLYPIVLENIALISYFIIITLKITVQEPKVKAVVFIRYIYLLKTHYACRL